MQYRVLGRTGLRVSEVGFGGAPIGIPNYNEVWDPHAPETTRAVITAIHRAIEIGYNYFDTAPSYGEGRSEELVGEALRGRRQQVTLATKTEWHAKSRTWIRERVLGSLGRLQTDYLDVLQFHGSDWSPEDLRFIVEDGPLEELQRLRAEGLVRFLGITAEEPASLHPLLSSGLFDIIQIRYNLIYQGAWHTILPLAERHELGIVLMRPLSSGIFQKLMRHARPDIDQYLDLHALALQYVLSDPRIHTAIVGMRRAEEVERNNAISDLALGRIDLDWLHERQVRAEGQP